MNDKSSRKISFTDFELTNGYIGFSFDIKCGLEEIGEENSGFIYFKLMPDILPRSNLIAIAISTLCGRKNYDNIHFDLNVNSSIITDISKFTLAKVTSKPSFEHPIKRKNKNNITLNFSGGFDSLAAKCLMPEEHSLVSIDYGGRFSRERQFFEKFSHCIMETNIVDSPLRKNSWSFMGIASILFSDYLETNYYTFGGILEAGVNNISENPIAAKNISFPPFLAAGMENAPYVLGLTEIGTLKVIANYHPELIASSLDSLANPGEEKRYRKQVLASILSEKMEMDFGLNIIDRPSKIHYKFGQYFAPDFLSFYVIKNAGEEIASHTISHIPYEVVEAAERLSLNFYERVNTNFLVNFPKQLRSDLLLKLDYADVIAYTEADWKEFNEIRQILSKYHKL